MNKLTALLPALFLAALVGCDDAKKKKDAIAQFNWGMEYYVGQSVEKDLVKAAEFFRKAAEHGNAPAQYYLGIMYQKGEAVSKDSAKAAEWYRKAAEMGNADAQYNLGEMYNFGEGVKRDTIEGLAWLNIAVANGKQNAIKSRDFCEGLLEPEGKLAAQRRSKEILKEIKAAKAAQASTKKN